MVITCFLWSSNGKYNIIGIITISAPFSSSIMFFIMENILNCDVGMPIILLSTQNRIILNGFNDLGNYLIISHTDKIDTYNFNNI